jgi:multidrug efflux pump subunit AcrA (membrane-fusion protein)
MSVGTLLHLGTTHARRTASVAGVVVLAGVIAWIMLSASGSVAAPTTVLADRGTVTVSVSGSGPVSAGGVGTAASTSSFARPAALAAAAGPPAGLQVFPGVSGQLLKVLVSPGQLVHTGQPIALLGDPTAAGALMQARIALQSASLPVVGAASQLVVMVAQKKLAAASVPAKSALTQARLDLATARLAYENIRRAPARPTSAALAAAKLAVTLSEQKLGAMYQPAPQGSVLAAQLAVAQAEATLGALGAVPPGPFPSEVRAAELACRSRESCFGAGVRVSGGSTC